MGIEGDGLLGDGRGDVGYCSVAAIVVDWNSGVERGDFLGGECAVVDGDFKLFISFPINALGDSSYENFTI